MGGCTSCGGGEQVCQSREDRKEALCAEWMKRLYPTGRWGELLESARAGFTRKEVVTLGPEASTMLRAPVYLVPQNETDLSEALYVLCLGRHPGAITLASSDEVVSEVYLRILFSTLVRAACVQEVRVTLGGNLLDERPRDGVFDPVLLKRFRKITGWLESLAIEHLDMGVLEAAPGGVPQLRTDRGEVVGITGGERGGGVLEVRSTTSDKAWDFKDKPRDGSNKGHPRNLAGNEYAARFGCQPTYFNWLFSPEPVETVRTVLLPNPSLSRVAHVGSRRPTGRPEFTNGEAVK